MSMQPFLLKPATSILGGILPLLFGSLSFGEKPNFQLSWPTPNPAFAKGLGYSTFLQKTGPDKEFSSGAFGCVRNNGYKFHEGLDLYPVRRDKRGRAEDSIFAITEGIVTHINATAGYSAYGKYMVLEHKNLTPSLYSLYAHLDSISPKLAVGSKVSIAQVIGKMGNSSSGYRIPLDRSHLHFEIGLRLTNQFQNWYNKKRFSSKNRHGNYSGFNLVGIDPIHFYSEYKKKSFATPADFIRSLSPSVIVQVKTEKTPDFVTRYPSLSTTKKSGSSNGWKATFGPFGIPLLIEPVSKPIGPQEKQVKILSFNLDSQKKPCRRLTKKIGDRYIPADQLQTYLELLFEL